MTESIGRDPSEGSPATPRLSVIIASWNAAHSIERAIDSVIAGHEVDLECVVVDDGSSDGTADVVAAMAARDPRIVLVRLPANVGVSEARNAALDVARGEWLTFLDADDRLLPGGVAALMGPTPDPQVRVVIGQRIWTDDERTWMTPLYDIPDIRTPGRTSIAARPGLLYYASATGRVLRRSLVGERRFEGRVLGDQPWAIHAMLAAGDGIEVIGQIVYEWHRPHPDRYVATLTAETRASARRAVEMADVARIAFLAVSADVDALIADAERRPVIKRTYFERLVRADIADRLRVAADRHDPSIGPFYEAVGRFFEAIPPAILASTDVHLRHVLRSAAYRYSALSAGGRRGYWRMIGPILAGDARSSRQIGGNPAFALAVWLVRRWPSPSGEAAAGAILYPISLAARLARRFKLA